jgi:SM-20-related protein
MPKQDATFTYLDETAIEAAELKTVPYEWAYLRSAIPARFLDKVLADAPKIPEHGSYGVPHLKYGPEFDALIKELLSDRFRRIVEKKFHMDLSNSPPVVVMTGNTSGRYNEGYAHPDSKHKIVTVIVGFTRDWPHQRGRLRVLNGPDRNDYAFEFAPEFGCMWMFKVSDRSWHGFLPQKGPHMSLQLCYCDSEAYVRRVYRRHRFSAFMKSIPIVNKILGLMPRQNPSANVLGPSKKSKG